MKPDNTRYKVFLVDDDTKHLVMLKNHLEKKSDYNLDINIFSNGEACMERLNERPDVVVLDYFLDGIRSDAANGLEILKRINASEQAPTVIMMSGQDNIKVAVDTIDNGAYDYIIKGESAYLRAQMIIDHILRNRNMVKFMTDQKKKENMLIGVIILLFAILIVFAVVNRGFI
jgi:two-component system OmpR family response regulator